MQTPQPSKEETKKSHDEVNWNKIRNLLCLVIVFAIAMHSSFAFREAVYRMFSSSGDFSTTSPDDPSKSMYSLSDEIKRSLGKLLFPPRRISGKYRGANDHIFDFRSDGTMFLDNKALCTYVIKGGVVWVYEADMGRYDFKNMRYVGPDVDSMWGPATIRFKFDGTDLINELNERLHKQ